MHYGWCGGCRVALQIVVDLVGGRENQILALRLQGRGGWFPLDFCGNGRLSGCEICEISRRRRRRVLR